jgi:hypothetical protein
VTKVANQHGCAENVERVASPVLVALFRDRQVRDAHGCF